MSQPTLTAPELLSPAGTYRNMRYAYAYGADAVYAGQPRYSLRARNNDFDVANVVKGIAYAHERGKKFFVASNVLPHDNKIDTYIRDMTPIMDAKPDALIMADPGLIMMVREHWPDAAIHISVQANTMNAASVKFWQSVGATRVILSRELGLKEIREIRERCTDMELEVFVHGALCIAFSGRCLLSGYFNHRDPNQGACTNSCRWKYKTHAASENETGDIVKNTASDEPAQSIVQQFQPDSAASYLLEEENRPGEYMPIEEDEHGTYIMNSKDLRAVQHVPELVQMGIDSLKIEGRTKSHFYVARTAQVYRAAIDAAVAGQPFDMELMSELEGLANRGYTEGFYRRHVPDEYQNYEGNHSTANQKFVAEIIDNADHSDMMTIDIKNRLTLGDEATLFTPSGNIRFKVTHMESEKGQKIDIAPGSGHRVRIPNPGLSQLEFGLIAIETPA